MEHARHRELRNPSEKYGAANRKKDPLEFEEFLVRWRSELRRQSVDWDGRRAVAELKRKKMYEFLGCYKKSDTEWLAEDLLIRILDEMQRYRRETVDRLEKEYFDRADEFLRSMQGKIQEKEDETALPGLKALLSSLRKKVERTRTTVGKLMRDRSDWHFGVWQQLWPEIPRKNLVSRKIELDTRLQRELGKKLADYLRTGKRRERVSWETIARLILLAYRVGELTYDDESGTNIHSTGHKLIVRNIRENLRNGGLHKAATFQGQQIGSKLRDRTRKV